MNAISKRPATAGAIRVALRELGSQLTQLNRRVGSRVDLKDVDLDCLDLIARRGPLSPSTLAKAAHLHPATVTGVLDRLEAEGWVLRERDPADRRAVLVRPLGARAGEMIGLYAGMNGAIDRICMTLQPHELQVIADFLSRVAEAGRAASEDLERK